MDRAGFGASDDPPPDFIVAHTSNDVEDLVDSLSIDHFGLLVRSGAVPHGLGCAALLGDRVSAVVGLAGLAPRIADINWTEGVTDDNERMHNSAKDGDGEAVMQSRMALAAEFRKNPKNFFSHIIDSLKPGQTTDLLDIRLGMGLEIATGIATGVRTGTGWSKQIIALQKDWGFHVEDVLTPSILWRGLKDHHSTEAHVRWLYEHMPNAWLYQDPTAGHFTAHAVTVGALRFIRDVHVGLRRAWLATELYELATPRLSQSSHILDANGMLQTRVLDHGGTLRERLARTRLDPPHLSTFAYKDAYRLNEAELARRYPALWARSATSAPDIAAYIQRELPGALPPYGQNTP